MEIDNKLQCPNRRPRSLLLIKHVTDYLDGQGTKKMYNFRVMRWLFFAYYSDLFAIPYLRVNALWQAIH